MDYHEALMEAPRARHISRTQHTARKERPCAMCPAPIRPGDRYERDVWDVEGVIEVQEQHVAGCVPWDADCPAYEDPFQDDLPDTPKPPPPDLGWEPPACEEEDDTSLWPPEDQP